MSRKCIRNSAVEIFLPLHRSFRTDHPSVYSLSETRAAGERNYFHPAMLHASNYPIDKIVIQRDGKRVLHNADIWSEPPWIFQRIRNERELPQSEEDLLLFMEVRTGNRLCLPLHPPAIDASLISLLKPGDLAATRADIFVYKSDLWPGGPSSARDINVIQRLCAVHLHNVILKHLHNASIRGAAPRWIFQNVSLSVPGANRILCLLLPQFRRSFRESFRAKSSRVIRQISRIWNAREIFTKQLRLRPRRAVSDTMMIYAREWDTHLRFVYEAFTNANLDGTGLSVLCLIHVRYTDKEKLLCKWWWII